MSTTQMTWHPMGTAPKDIFVLLACPSGYRTTPWVFTTGIMHSDYKADRWVDHANDDLSDWGMEPVAWTHSPPEPTNVTEPPAEMAGEECRKTVLLRACLDLLKKCGEGPYVKNALTETVFYDGADCAGGCLANDIAVELGEDEVF